MQCEGFGASLEGEDGPTVPWVGWGLSEVWIPWIQCQLTVLIQSHIKISKGQFWGFILQNSKSTLPSMF